MAEIAAGGRPHEILIATAYFTVGGWLHLAEALNGASTVKLLVGSTTAPGKAEKPDPEVMDRFELWAKSVDDHGQPKVHIREIGPNQPTLHAKAFIIRRLANIVAPHPKSLTDTITLVGSANLTDSGMTRNRELVSKDVGPQSVSAEWFKELWDLGDSVDPADFFRPAPAADQATTTDIQPTPAPQPSIGLTPEPEPSQSTSTSAVSDTAASVPEDAASELANTPAKPVMVHDLAHGQGTPQDRDPDPIPYKSYPPSLNVNGEHPGDKSELVQGLLYELEQDESWVTLMVGSRGTFKSFALLGLGMRIAAGVAPAMRQGKVFYLAGEAPHEVNRRAAVMLGNYEKVPQDAIRQNMRIGDRPVWFDDSSPVWTGLRDHLRDDHRPDVVIVDTFQHIMPTASDENSARDMRLLMRTIRKTARCHWIITHHTGKEFAGARGSSVLEADADTVWGISNHSDRETPTPTIRVTKSRDRPYGYKWQLQFDPIGAGLVLDDIVRVDKTGRHTGL